MNRGTLYLLFCVIGALLPLSQFIPWVAQHGLHMQLFFEDLFSNRIGGFFGLDVIVSAVVLITWILSERVRYWWLAVLGTLLIGVSFGLPLYLYLRYRFLT